MALYIGRRSYHTPRCFARGSRARPLCGCKILGPRTRLARAPASSCDHRGSRIVTPRRCPASARRRWGSAARRPPGMPALGLEAVMPARPPAPCPPRILGRGRAVDRAAGAAIMSGVPKMKDARVAHMTTRRQHRMSSAPSWSTSTTRWPAIGGAHGSVSSRRRRPRHRGRAGTRR